MLYEYYNRHLWDESYIAWLAVTEDRIIGTSGMSFVAKPPYYSNPSRKIGFAPTTLGRFIAEQLDIHCWILMIIAVDGEAPLHDHIKLIEKVLE